MAEIKIYPTESPNSRSIFADPSVKGNKISIYSTDKTTKIVANLSYSDVVALIDLLKQMIRYDF